MGPHKQVERKEQQRKRKKKRKWNENNLEVETKEGTPSIKKCKGCDQKGDTEEKFWKMHLEKCPKHFQKRKKKTFLSMDPKEWVENTLNLEGNINFNNIHKEVALVSHSHKQEKEMNDLFYIKIHMK